MAKTYYELLDLPPSASEADIKRAFRREIAKYHPDKVQHLGTEFQEIAVSKAAELTQVYQTLGDADARVEYDTQLNEQAVSRSAASTEPSAAAVAAPPVFSGSREAPGASEAGPSAAAIFEQDRAGALDLVRRATMMRFRQALETEFGSYQDAAVDGFEVTCIPKAPFWSLRLPPRVLGRFLPQVTGATVSETWALALRIKTDPQRDLCVFVMGPSVAASGELAQAIAEQRRKPMPAGGKMVMIPVNTKTWNAHVPTDAPPVVKSLLTRLKS